MGALSLLGGAHPSLLLAVPESSCSLMHVTVPCCHRSYPCPFLLSTKSPRLFLLGHAVLWGPLILIGAWSNGAQQPAQWVLPKSESCSSTRVCVRVHDGDPSRFKCPQKLSDGNSLFQYGSARSHQSSYTHSVPRTTISPPLPLVPSCCHACLF